MIGRATRGLRDRCLNGSKVDKARWARNVNVDHLWSMMPETRLTYQGTCRGTQVTAFKTLSRIDKPTRLGQWRSIDEPGIASGKPITSTCGRNNFPIQCHEPLRHA